MNAQFKNILNEINNMLLIMLIMLLCYVIKNIKWGGPVNM